MKSNRLFAVTIMLFSLITTKAQLTDNQSKQNNILAIAQNIEWFGQSAIKIVANNKVIYIDPYNLPADDKADIILITHAHGDHLSVADIKKINNPKTVIYAPADCCKKLNDGGFNNCKPIAPNSNIEIVGIQILAVAAYNTNKDYHPKTNNWVGYVLTINDVKIYHPGDTQRIPEMKEINCDIAFMPLGQTYTMTNVEEAVNAILDTKAKIAIPFHYGMYEGSNNDALMFKKLLEGKVKVVLKEYKQ